MEALQRNDARLTAGASSSQFAFFIMTIIGFSAF